MTNLTPTDIKQNTTVINILEHPAFYTKKKKYQGTITASGEVKTYDLPIVGEIV